MYRYKNHYNKNIPSPNILDCKTVQNSACPVADAPTDRKTSNPDCKQDAFGHWNCPNATGATGSYPVPGSNLSYCICSGNGVCDGTNSICKCNIEYAGDSCSTCAPGYSIKPPDTNCTKDPPPEPYYCYIYGDNTCVNKESALAYKDPIILKPDGTPSNTTKWLGPYNSIQQCKTSNPYTGCEGGTYDDRPSSLILCQDIEDKSCCMSNTYDEGYTHTCDFYGMFPTGQWLGHYPFAGPNYGCTPYPTQQCAFCGDNHNIGQGCCKK